MIQAETEFHIEFYDCDPMNVVWHGNYFRFFEAARRALLDKLRYGYSEMERKGCVFPVIKTSAKFIQSFKLDDVVRAKATLTEYETCIKIKYELFNAKTGTLYTKGESTQMAFDVKSNQSLFACPDDFVQRVKSLL
ncbi:MAG: thioesterase family protein [Termitinemataceae bacterium]|nr:MAG: thioesterase family protein [Termitinemataceae bacterium]